MGLEKSDLDSFLGKRGGVMGFGNKAATAVDRGGFMGMRVSFGKSATAAQQAQHAEST